MPNYDYECKTCGHNFEEFQSMLDAPLKKCPSCGKRTLRRLIGGGTGIIFRGSGFYVNDSKSVKKNGSASTTPSTAKSGDSGSTTSSSEAKTA
ncbi:MAG: FmdB family zinc ribbon protein [Spirochaetota bacterium]